MSTLLHPAVLISIASLVIFLLAWAYVLWQMRHAKKILYTALKNSFDNKRKQSERRRAFNRHCRKQLEAYGRVTASR